MQQMDFFIIFKFREEIKQNFQVVQSEYWEFPQPGAFLCHCKGDKCSCPTGMLIPISEL